jgi:hypothetical protein
MKPSLVWHDHDIEDEGAEKVCLLETNQWSILIGYIYQSDSWAQHTRTGPWRAWYSSCLGGVGIGVFETPEGAMKAVEDQFAKMVLGA